MKSKLVQVQRGEGLPKPSLSDSNKVTLGPNTRIELGMFIVQQIFHNELILFRVKLELDTIAPENENNFEQIASL